MISSNIKNSRSLLFVTITIMIHVVASSTNMTTSPEKGLWNHIHVRVITRKKEGLWHICKYCYHRCYLCFRAPEARNA